MTPTSTPLRLAEVRRIAVAAQGLAEPRPTGRIDRRHLRRVLDRVGVVQIDSVNVLTRSHELPFLARLGPYPRTALADWLWGSGEVIECWAHEASLVPAELHRLLRWRMARPHQWRIEVDPELAELVARAVRERGPVALGPLADVLGEAVRRGPGRPGSMWNWSPAKRAVEHLFWSGAVAATRDPVTFERRYAAPEALVAPAALAAPTPPEDEALAELLVRAARAHGVGTARHLADYHRLHVPTARRVLAGLAADGVLEPVAVEGWRDPAYRHPAARAPRRVVGRALLSPFDSLVWERDRTEALFGFRYRLEIYTPAAKRVHGYYVLPFLHDGALTARVDLKADRATGRLLVRAAHGEAGIDPAHEAVALRGALEELAGFLGLGEVAVGSVGDLAPALSRLG